MNRGILAALVAGATMIGGGAMAQTAPAAKTPTGPFGGDITGIVTLANEYSFRGISQTQRDPAVQGGLTYEVPLGKLPLSLYGGFWGSNVNFPGDINESLELDLVAGVRSKLFNDKFTVDFGYIGYLYPGTTPAASANFHEVGLVLGYDFDFAAVTAGVRWSPNYFGGSGNAWYKVATLTVPLPFVSKVAKDVSAKLVGSVGHQSIERNAAFGSPDYLDFAAGITVTAFTLDFTAQVIGTSLREVDCAGTRFCAVRPYFSIGKSF